MQLGLIRECCGDESEEGQDVQVPRHLERLCHTLSLEKLLEAGAAAKREDVPLCSSEICPSPGRGACWELPEQPEEAVVGAGPRSMQLAEVAAPGDGYHERWDSAPHRPQVRERTSPFV